MSTLPVASEFPRILVVEDDPIASGILTLYLEDEGYPFVTVSNGREALDCYRREYFPIIITDWIMPEMDGIDLCRAIRETPTDRYAYIILVTGEDSDTNLVCGLEAGADEYLVKPLHQAELRARLNGARRILNLEASLKKSLAEIHELSIRDHLTGAFNRGYMDHQIVYELKRSNRYLHPLSVIICDLDHFKAVNDTFGHQAGDEVLKFCVASITSSIRKSIDWLARYGGEEFLIVLPETDEPGCMVVAERIRALIASRPVLAFGCEIEVTASFGAVTIMPGNNKSVVYAEEALQMADACLYQAKNDGRNRVVSTRT